jgi:hypothetical protein
VTVAFNLTDDDGHAIERTVLDTLRFTLSHLDAAPQTGLTHWVSDIVRTQKSTITGITVTQPNDENNTPTSDTGTFIALGNGVYRYTFAARLPEGFNPTRTYRIGVQARRTPVAGRSFVDNATFDFRPDGVQPLATRGGANGELPAVSRAIAFHGSIRTK